MKKIFILLLLCACSNYSEKKISTRLPAAYIELKNPDIVEENSQTNRENPKLVNAILNLNQYDEIPDSVIKNNSVNDIAFSLVKRIEQQTSNSSKIVKNKYDFYNDSEIQIAFNESVFDKIKAGCFKNQFQIKTTNGAYNLDARAEAENALLELTLDNSKDEFIIEKINKIRPKYAYFVPTKPMKNVNGHRYDSQYGNIIAVLKNKIKDRTTFTADDSLATFLKAEAVNSIQDYKKLRLNHVDFWEAQIWGELCFSDVDYFLINCEKQKVSESILKSMREINIPFYQCKKIKSGVNEVFSKLQK